MLSYSLVRTAAAASRGPAMRQAFAASAVAASHQQEQQQQSPKPRTPSIADIGPEQLESFKSRQKTFRAQLVEAARLREASKSSPMPVVDDWAKPQDVERARARGQGGRSASATTTITAGFEEASLSTRAHGSASPATAPVIEGVSEEFSKKEKPHRNAGPLTSLIYGTKEGREMDAQIAASFSQILARGKYVHSIVFHEVKPSLVDDYVELVGEWYPAVANLPENKVNLVGSWRTEVGDCNTFVHIWEYQRYQGYHASLHAMSRHPDFAAFERRLQTLITSKNTSLMQEFSFWPTTPPRRLGGLFELRSYHLHPGNLLEWEKEWRRGLQARREVMEGVGAWFVQIGDLNTVHHLWQFADLEERKRQREESWEQEGWAETVHRTVPLIQDMKSRILVPMTWSPVA